MAHQHSNDTVETDEDSAEYWNELDGDSVDKYGERVVILQRANFPFTY